MKTKSDSFLKLLSRERFGKAPEKSETRRLYRRAIKAAAEMAARREEMFVTAQVFRIKVADLEWDIMQYVHGETGCNQPLECPVCQRWDVENTEAEAFVKERVL